MLNKHIIPNNNISQNKYNRNIVGYWNDHIVIESTIKWKVLKLLLDSSPIFTQNISINLKIINMNKVYKYILQYWEEYLVKTKLFNNSERYIISQDYIEWKILSSDNLHLVNRSSLIKFKNLIKEFHWNIDIFWISWYYAYKNIHPPSLSNVMLDNNWDLKVIDYDIFIWKHSEFSAKISVYNLYLLIYPSFNAKKVKTIVESLSDPWEIFN
jgi:hypothetical protein